MTWGRSLGGRLFGVKRRSRRLRHVLEELAAASARAAGRASDPRDAAYHEGERAAYVAALGRLAGAAPAQPAAPPPGAARSAWARGYAAAGEHATRLFDEVR